MFDMIELIDTWSVYLKDTQINLFLDFWVSIFAWLNKKIFTVSNVK